MIVIQALDEGTLWDVASFCYRHPECEEEFSSGDRARFEEGCRRRSRYLRRMLPKGGRAQIAYEQGRPVGFVEYYPIEVTNLEVEGQDLMAIWCIHVRKDQRGRGIGTRLLQACLDDARHSGRKGVVTTCWDPFWMPHAIFERNGFSEVGPAGANGLVLLKAFAAVEAPRWIARKPLFRPVEGRLCLDIYHTDRCPVHFRNTALVIKVAGAFGPAVLVREYCTDERAQMCGHGTAYGVYLNGRLIASGPLADEVKVRARFERELAKLREGDLA
jgi:GNAT superfamily N-acetyltransferase